VLYSYVVRRATLHRVCVLGHICTGATYTAVINLLIYLTGGSGLNIILWFK